MKMKKLKLHLIAVTLIFILSGVLIGKPVIPKLEALTKNADLIVVAQVEEVIAVETKSEIVPKNLIYGDLRIASARVLEIWKGSTGDNVKFRASKSWTCDSSKADVGETVILFLTNEPNSPVKSIAYSGIGRFLIKENSILLSRQLLTKERIDFFGFTEEIYQKQIEINIFRQQVQSILEGKSNSVE